MRIVNTSDSITIGLISFPKNSVIAAIADSNQIKISVVGTSNPILVEVWTNFTNEFNIPYNSASEVIADLLRSHNGSSQSSDQVKVDSASDLVTYVGYSAPLSLVSEPKWAVLKITSTSTSVPSETKFEWATAYKQRTHIWNNRLSLSYVS